MTGQLSLHHVDDIAVFALGAREVRSGRAGAHHRRRLTFVIIFKGWHVMLNLACVLQTVRLDWARQGDS